MIAESRFLLDQISIIHKHTESHAYIHCYSTHLYNVLDHHFIILKTRLQNVINFLPLASMISKYLPIIQEHRSAKAASYIA
jgi:hypothetical protein